MALHFTPTRRNASVKRRFESFSDSNVHTPVSSSKETPANRMHPYARQSSDICSRVSSREQLASFFLLRFPLLLCRFRSHRTHCRNAANGDNVFFVQSDCRVDDDNDLSPFFFRHGFTTRGKKIATAAGFEPACSCFRGTRLNRSAKQSFHTRSQEPDGYNPKQRQCATLSVKHSRQCVNQNTSY